VEAHIRDQIKGKIRSILDPHPFGCRMHRINKNPPGACPAPHNRPPSPSHATAPPSHPTAPPSHPTAVSPRLSACWPSGRSCTISSSPRAAHGAGSSGAPGVVTMARGCWRYRSAPSSATIGSPMVSGWRPTRHSPDGCASPARPRGLSPNPVQRGDPRVALPAVPDLSPIMIADGPVPPCVTRGIP